MEVKHTTGAWTTIDSPPQKTNEYQMHSRSIIKHHDNIVDDHKAAVIGRSKCTVARKMEQGTTPAWDTGAWDRGADAAPHPNIPLSTNDELPPPLLNGGQGKTSPTTGVDDGDSEMEDGLQTAPESDGDRTDEFVGARDEVMTAIRDRIRSSDASRQPNRVDLPQSETTPKLPNVVPPSGEEMTSVPVDMMVNGDKPPKECTPIRTINGVRWQDPIHWVWNEAHTSPVQGRATTWDGIQPPILLAMGHLATGADTDKL